MTSFDRLHPAVQHHIVNSLCWPALRPLQEQAIEPIVAGEHALLIAPTAGGKTEAGFFPVLSRMVAEDWRGLSVLYVCPIKALLNNLEHRLTQYAGFVGRRVQLWHGDITAREKSRVVFERPEVLLTTPESIEVLLVSRDPARRELLRDVRVVIIDELHAFAGDDRGWHLLAVLERVSHLAGRSLQRIGLSATVGNPEDLLQWLRGSAPGAGRVIAPDVGVRIESAVEVDYVGTIANAASVISRLHRGEKRLVFVDSRSRVEELAAQLRQRQVETYVSHGSLGLDERRLAEQAFAEGQNCVIVATSTLELGIDVGDLDRVIQIDAPGTVASFLQRLGRTGRRPGATRNCLFLATTDDALLRACGIIRLWADGYMEPLRPPPSPYHLFAQQILALTLQLGRVGRTGWRDHVGALPAFQAMPEADLRAILDHMVSAAILCEEDGLLSMGPGGEHEFGHKNFLDLFSIFTTPPLFQVVYGRKEIGHVHEMSFYASRPGEPLILTLGGRSWTVVDLDWSRQVARVAPASDPGRSRWLGSGLPLSFELCQAMARVLAGEEVGCRLTRRSSAQLQEMRDAVPWMRAHETAVVWDERDRVRWWTFAGLRANIQLSELTQSTPPPTRPDRNLFVDIGEPADADAAAGRIDSSNPGDLPLHFDERMLDQVKFRQCLPDALLIRMLRQRFEDRRAIEAVAKMPRRVVRQIADG